jgi:divalent metal cation (Fe/Co/Zn/Cd) transporter
MHHDPAPAPISPYVHHGLRISAYSLTWTIVAGSGAIVVGVLGNSLTLAVFGVIGLLDAVGSWTLVGHFKHAIRHEGISQHRERLTLLIVGGGMAAVGVATVGDSAYRLEAHVKGSPLFAGIILAAVSVVALALLAAAKHRIAGRIPSNALKADGWLSATGALLAAVALLGTTLDKAFAWWWVDPAAAIGVASGALALSVVMTRGAYRPIE